MWNENKDSELRQTSTLKISSELFFRKTSARQPVHFGLLFKNGANGACALFNFIQRRRETSKSFQIKSCFERKCCSPPLVVGLCTVQLVAFGADKQAQPYNENSVGELSCVCVMK